MRGCSFNGITLLTVALMLTQSSVDVQDVSRKTSQVLVLKVTTFQAERVFISSLVAVRYYEIVNMLLRDFLCFVRFCHDLNLNYCKY